MKSLEPKNCHVVSSPNWSSGELRFSCTVWVWDKISMTVCWNYDIICIHIYLYIFIYLHTHTNTLAGSVCIYIYIFTCIYIYTSYILIFTYILYIYVCIIYIHTCIYIYTYVWFIYVYIKALSRDFLVHPLWCHWCHVSLRYGNRRLSMDSHSSVSGDLDDREGVKMGEGHNRSLKLCI